MLVKAIPMAPDSGLTPPPSNPEPPAGDTPRLASAAALAELSRIDLRRDDLEAVLHRIADLARSTVPGADEVSVSLVGRKGKATTPAHTGAMALQADEAQYAQASGPCVDAAEGGQLVLVEDMTTEQRWPQYVARARAAGVLSSLSVPLPVQESLTGALNIYSRSVGAFGPEAVEAAQGFASYAAVAVANAQLYETTAALAHQMEEAMASRAIIEQAKGLIMGQRRCSADEAFRVLVDASSRSNRKLRDVAADLLAAVREK